MRVFPLTYIHATDWVLLAQNIGEYCSIDETQLCEDVYTILSNKAGHGKKGTVDIPASELGKVKEITMDFSDSMYNIAKQCFPNADIVIDCFHIVQRLCGGLEEMRLKFLSLGGSNNEMVGAYQGQFIFIEKRGVFFSKDLDGVRFFALARTGDGRLAIPGAIQRDIDTATAAPAG